MHLSSPRSVPCRAHPTPIFLPPSCSYLHLQPTIHSYQVFPKRNLQEASLVSFGNDWEQSCFFLFILKTRTDKSRFHSLWVYGKFTLLIISWHFSGIRSQSKSFSSPIFFFSLNWEILLLSLSIETGVLRSRKRETFWFEALRKRIIDMARFTSNLKKYLHLKRCSFVPFNTQSWKEKNWALTFKLVNCISMHKLYFKEIII